MNVRQADSIEVGPAERICGDIVMPGDKSISHRLCIIGSIAEGPTRIHNFATSADCRSTVACLQRLGVSFREDENAVIVEGRGLDGF